MQYLARSAVSESGQPQAYLDHVLHVLVRGRCYLRKVLRYAQGWDASTIQRILELASEYHDLGKLDEENQSVLAGEKKTSRLPVAHADAGVAHLVGQDVWLAALLVYSHHAGLPDIGDVNVLGIRNSSVEHTVDQNLPELLRRHEISVRSVISSKPLARVVPHLHPADFRVLFSCLTHADHGDAARASHQEYHRTKHPKLRAAERLEALRSYVNRLSSNGEKSMRNRMRSEFFGFCSNGTCETEISICDAPVGTGKTTAVMSHLLGLADKRGLRRIFVILPFTNIISQSVETYRKALTLGDETADNVVAEIHHRADFESPESRRLTALWDAPIVVTTAVAFFETLASAAPATLRRLQNLPGSAIFLDEAHAMLPVKLLPLAWQWIQHAASKWSCHWVLASGSLCHFWTLKEFSESGVCLPNILPEEQQKKMSGFEFARVHHRYRPDPMSLDALVAWLYDLEGPIIVVLNTVHTAAAAAKTAERIFGRGNVLHLSTSLIPRDREITLNQVRDRLKHKAHLKWCLFATSCVEAGVDLSFRTGVRECASLLSVLQLAGRVNRNSEYGNGNTDVWTVTLNTNDCGVTSNPSLLCSARILREYFERRREITPELCTEAMQKEIREQGVFSTRMLDEESRYSFKTIANDFKVIEDDSQLTVIDPELVRRIEAFEDVSWRDIQNGSVQIRKTIRERLCIEESRRYPGILLWPKGAKYSPFLGYMEAVLDLLEFDSNGGAVI